MFTGITTRAGSLVTGIVMLTGAAILQGGVAAADPQDDQFLALLSQKGIPALQGVPHLIATAHRICRNLDGGASASSQVDAMRNHAYDTDASDARQYPPERLTRTFTRFVTAAVQAYCPADQGKIASIMANRAPVSDEPTYRAAAYTHNAVNSGSDLRETASLITEIPPPDPPQIPPQPPAAEKLIPPQPVAAPPPPKQLPPPPIQPPPPPKQPPPPPQQPPATQLRQAPPPPLQVVPPGPQPGGGAGGGGNGGAGIGGGGPAGVGGGDDAPGVVKVAP